MWQVHFATIGRFRCPVRITRVTMVITPAAHGNATKVAVGGVTQGTADQTSSRTPQLVGLQKAAFNRAAKMQRWLRRLQWGLAGTAVASVFLSSEIAGYFLAIAAASFTCGYTVLSLILRAQRSYAEHVRRVILIYDGLAEAPPESTLLSINSEYTGSIDTARKNEVGDYFSSTASGGPRRIIDLLHENAFWTQALNRYNTRSAILRLCVYGLLSISIFFLSITMSGSSLHIMTLSRVFFGVVLALVSSDLLGTVVACVRAGSSLAQVRAEIDGCIRSGYRSSDVLSTLLNYNSVVEAAPLHEPRIYEKHRWRILQDWQRSRSDTQV